MADQSKKPIASKEQNSQRLSESAEKEAVKNLSTISTNDASVHIEEFKSNTENFRVHGDHISAAISNAESPEEREKYLNMSKESFYQTQKDNVKVGERSNNTQQGIAKMTWIAIGSMALTTAIYLKFKK